jgi:rRNA pseudouridine-1189 N-methylase Emg1 (Nep1/Mra1 family)
LKALHPEKVPFESKDGFASAVTDVGVFVMVSHSDDDQAKKERHSEVVHVSNQELMRHDVVCFFCLRIRNCPLICETFLRQ